MTLYNGKGQAINLNTTVTMASEKTTFGGEYLNGWYKKLFFGNAVTIAVDGDSTTQEAYEYMKVGRRVDIIEKIMKLGNYPSNLITINKNGYGSKASGDYVGSYYSSVIMGTGGEPNQTSHPNGLLSVTMAQNPDLIIFGYGLNDYNRYKTATTANGNISMTIQERLNLFKSNLEEFLQRLRGAANTTVNGRECYGKSEYDTAVILCVPIEATGHENWATLCRDMIKNLCTTYKCAFFDPTVVNSDHLWNLNWSRDPWGNADGTHPQPWTNADFVSYLQPLLFPCGLWFSSDEQVYNITYNLANGVTLDNTMTSIRKGTKYESNVTGATTVTVTKGGSAVSNAYSNNKIQVSQVNGDIVITAS